MDMYLKGNLCQTELKWKIQFTVQCLSGLIDLVDSFILSFDLLNIEHAIRAQKQKRKSHPFYLCWSNALL